MGYAGGDYKNPTKESLIGLVEKLAGFVAQFRAEKIIKEHRCEILKLIDRI